MDQIPSGSAMAGDADAKQNDDQNKSKVFQEFMDKLVQLDLQYPKGLPYEPQSYSAQPETHLNFDNLIEEDKEKRERANYFVCAICAMVVKDPKECGSCQSLFCAVCIQPWTQNNDSCPKKCRGSNAVEFQSLHRYAKQDLLALKYKCSMPECNFTGTYEKAMSHFNECEHQFLQCKFGCGLGIVGRDMKYHCMKECKHFKIECENCKYTAYPNDPERGGMASLIEHDCMQVLKDNLVAAREEITRLQAGGAPNFAGQHGQQLQVMCKQGCVMQKSRSQPISYTGSPSCDNCQQNEIDQYEYFYHCPVHEYDLCKVCALISCGVLRVNDQDRIELRGHGCPMRYEQNGDRHEGNHNCDGTQILGLGSECQSSAMYNLQNKNQQYIFCDRCNIDICICCAEKLSRM